MAAVCQDCVIVYGSWPGMCPNCGCAEPVSDAEPAVPPLPDVKDEDNTPQEPVKPARTRLGRRGGVARPRTSADSE